MKFLGLDRWSGTPSKRPPKDEVLLYADRDGGLHTIDHSGEVKVIGGSQLVNVIRFPFSFDTVDLTAAGGTIGSVDQGAKTFTFASRQLAAFPPGATFTVNGSTGNDGTYTVVSTSALDAVSLAVVTAEVIPDVNADGFLVPTINQGIDIYTPSVDEVILFIGCRVPTQFDGTTPSLEVGWTDDPSALQTVDLTQDDSVYNAHLSRTTANWGSLTGGVATVLSYFTDTMPVRVMLDTGSGGDPLSTAGEGELILVTVLPGA